MDISVRCQVLRDTVVWVYGGLEETPDKNKRMVNEDILDTAYEMFVKKQLSPLFSGFLSDFRDAIIGDVLLY